MTVAYQHAIGPPHHHCHQWGQQQAVERHARDSLAEGDHELTHA
jgi:hypothetical protein